MSAARIKIFVSSVQKELVAERQAIKAFVAGDSLLRRFFDVFLFEDIPASDRRADDVYLEEVDRCAIYVGLFGDTYGYEGPGGKSPTEIEFDRAKEIANIKRHKVSLTLARTILADLRRIEDLDSRFAYDEDRMVTIGTVRGMIFVAVWTLRGEIHRIISVRKAEKHECDRYYQEQG